MRSKKKLRKQKTNPYKDHSRKYRPYERCKNFAEYRCFKLPHDGYPAYHGLGGSNPAHNKPTPRLEWGNGTAGVSSMDIEDMVSARWSINSDYLFVESEEDAVFFRLKCSVIRVNIDT